MIFQLPAYVLTALEQLNKKGFEAYVVGGCVRDMLLGTEPYDFDVCTNATPEEIMLCFSSFRTVPTGIEHGTVTVVIENCPIEVTTYRIDGEYADSRHPNEVVFTSSLQEDLARRDFTINAMAYHPQKGLVDLYGGREDLKAKIIRCVGEPTLRFSEDALRILRALRFASVLNFTLEPALVAAMHILCDSMQKVAMERVFTEFTKLICGKGAGEILCHYSEVLSPLFTLDKTVFSLISKMPNSPIFRYALLLKNHENPSGFLKECKASNQLISQVTFLWNVMRLPLPQTLFETKKWVFLYGMKEVDMAVSMLRSLGEDTKNFEGFLKTIQSKNLCCTLKELAINGKDLLDIGIPSGEKLGETLHTVLFAVMQDAVANQKDDLLVYAKALYQ